MKLSATEKRIYALAQKWANARTKRIHFGEPNPLVSWGVVKGQTAKQRRACGRALLKLFKEREGRG